MLQKFLIFISVCLLYVQVHAQNTFTSVAFVKKIQGAFSLFSVDELGSLYAYTNNGQFKKYNSNLDSLAVFNDVRRYGKLFSIHAENPLRTMLYFRDYRTIILLDRMLQLIQKVDLRKLNLYQIKAIAQSYDNKIWIFDEQESKIKKITLEGTVDFESTDLRLVFDEKISPAKMFEFQGYLYLFDPVNGIYMFDYYGGFKRKLIYKNLIDLQPSANYLIGRATGELVLINPNQIDSNEFRFKDEWVNDPQIIFSSNVVFCLNRDGINKYSFKLNQ